MSEIISNANVNKTVKKTVKKTKISDQTEQEVQINDLTEEHYVREEVRDEVEGDKFNATIEVTNLLSKTLENLADLKDFRMKRMFETLSPKTSLTTIKRNEGVLETIKEEIKNGEAQLDQTDPLVLRQAELLEYKEALIFALLGVLKLRNEINVLGSVTGAKKDHSSGMIY